MNEREPIIEMQSSSFKAYFGTTMSNFQRCAEITPEGNVIFTKSLEPKHKEPEIVQFEVSLPWSADWARIRALGIERHSKDTPLVLEGELDKDKYYEKRELLPKESFPVAQVWMPREDVYWEGYNPVEAASDSERREFTRVFEAKNPLDILQEKSSQNINSTTKKSSLETLSTT